MIFSSRHGLPCRRPKPPAVNSPTTRNRRIFCDCGRPAIMLKLVKVGSDPQYTIRLPLCQECLKIEQEIDPYLE